MRSLSSNVRATEELTQAPIDKSTQKLDSKHLLTTDFLSSYKTPSNFLLNESLISNGLHDYSSRGVLVKKTSQKGKESTHKLFFSVDNKSIMLTNSFDVKCNFLRGKPSNPIKAVETIDIGEIDRIFRGQILFKSLQESSSRGTDAYDNNNAFSIVYDNGLRSLDLIVYEIDEYEKCLKVISDLLDLYQNSRKHVHPDILVAEHIWRRLRKKMDDEVSTSDLMRMMDELNVDLSKKEVSALHKNFCTQVLGCKMKKLTLIELADFLPSLRKKVGSDDNYLVERVTKKIREMSLSKVEKDDSKIEVEGNGRVAAEGNNVSVGNSGEVSFAAFRYFLRHKQKEKKIDIQQAQVICMKYNELAGEENPSKDYITKAGLEIYLMSEENDAFNPISGKVGICDMSQPLSDYWINTSNKTYRICGNEESESLLRRSGFRGQSILLKLYRGCRCIDIDIYDGGKKFRKEPVVCESEETVPKSPDQVTLFVDVLTAIKTFMLAYPDTYPIILGIENHCSISYQQKVASYIQSYLENYLYTPTNLKGVLPSPEALRGKVVVRSKRPDIMSTNPTVMCDDFDALIDLSADEAAAYQDEVIEGDDDTVRYEIKAGDIDAMSIISEAPFKDDISPEGRINIASEKVFLMKNEANKLEKDEFELTVKATQAEENLSHMVRKMGLTLDQLSRISENPKNPIHNNESYKSRVKSILRKVHEEVPQKIDVSFSEVIPSGTSDIGEQGIDVENYLVNGAEEARNCVLSAEYEASIANDAACVALVQFQEATVEVREAWDGLRVAQRNLTLDNEAGRKARESIRTSVEKVETAQQRVQTLKDFQQKCKDALNHAENVFSKAVTEAKMSKDRAEKAVKTAEKAKEQSELEQAQAEIEIRKEEQYQSKANELHHKYLDIVTSVKSSREQVHKITQSLKNIDKKIKTIEDDPRFKEERKEWFRQKVETGNDAFVPMSKLGAKHKQLLNERTKLTDRLEQACDRKELDRKNVQLDFDDATAAARQQANISSLAWRQADKSTSIAERLAEQSEKELCAINFRLAEREKAEVLLRRCEDEYNSCVDQLAEAERALVEWKEELSFHRNEANRKAGLVMTNTTEQEQIIKEKEEVENRARERFETAEKEKTHLENKLNEARNLQIKSTKVVSMARDEIAAETHRTNSRKQQERNAIIARNQANYLREKASEAKMKSDEARVKLAEAVASQQNAVDYKAKKDKIMKLSPTYAKLVLITTTKFKYWEKSYSLPHLHMHSFSESQMLFLCERGPSEWMKWIKFNTRHLTRTFPSKKLRQKPGNYNPMLPWSIGCQMVGMNTQTLSGMMLLVDGRFRENGSSGYVLKPPRLINRIYHAELESEKGKTLRIRIISGRFLPKPDCIRIKNPPISPRVKVIVYDGVPGKGTVQHTTKIVTKNGINPVWKDDGASFHIASPSVAVILFSVWDRDPLNHKDYFIAASAIPFSCLRQGFRSVSLFDANRSRRGLFGSANIIVEMSINSHRGNPNPEFNVNV